METWQEYSGVQINESKWGERRNNTENARNRDNGRRVWFGDGAKKRWKQEVKTTLFNIVQEQEGKIRKVEHDQHGTVMVVE